MTEGMIDDKSSPVELIAELVSSQVFSNEGLEAALRETAIAGTRLLNVDRISIWLHQPEELTFKCAVAFNRGDPSIETGRIIDLTGQKHNFQVLKKRHVMAVEDVRSDDRISLIRAQRLKTMKIGALMDGVIHQNDQFMGILVASHLHDPRVWKAEELAYLTILSQYVATLLERSSREVAETRLNDWVEMSTTSQWEMDADLCFTSVTGSNFISWGLTMDQILGKTRWETVEARLDDPNWVQHIRTMEARQPFRNFVYSKTTPAEGQKTFSVSGIPLYDDHGIFSGYRGTTIDVSNLIGAEDALKETEQRFTDLIEGSLQAIAVTVNRIVVFANEAFARDFGYDNEEVIGMRDIDFIADGFREEQDQNRIMKREGVKEIRGLTKTGEQRHMLANTSNIMWMGDSARLLTLFDITEQKIAEEHLRHAQKMEAVGELTGGIAHDFNNLLSIIVGNAEMMEDSVPETDELARTNLTNIQRAALGGAELTRRLLAFARQKPLKAEEIDVGDLVTGIRSMLGHTLDESIEVKISCEQGLGLVRLDPAQLENALLNIAVNARDAMINGGAFSVHCANYRIGDNKSNSINGLSPGDYVRVSATDTGSGIPAEILDRVFDPFFTTKEVGKGTGLGLSMVFGFARQSGGVATIESRPEEGTTVSLILPAVPSDQNQ